MIYLNALEDLLRAMTPGRLYVEAQLDHLSIVTEYEGMTVAEFPTLGSRASVDADAVCALLNAAPVLLEIARTARAYVTSLPSDTHFNHDGFQFLEALAKVSNRDI